MGKLSPQRQAVPRALWEEKGKQWFSQRAALRKPQELLPLPGRVGTSSFPSLFLLPCLRFNIHGLEIIFFLVVQAAETFHIPLQRLKIKTNPQGRLLKQQNGMASSSLTDKQGCPHPDGFSSFCCWIQPQCSFPCMWHMGRRRKATLPNSSCCSDFSLAPCNLVAGKRSKVQSSKRSSVHMGGTKIPSGAVPGLIAVMDIANEWGNPFCDNRGKNTVGLSCVEKLGSLS